MSSIVVNGDTSGSVTLAAPTVAGTVTVTLPSASGTMAVSGGSTSFTDLAYTGTLTGGTGVVNLGSGQVYKDASGNVGIGTSSPARKLEVSDAGDGQIRITGTAAANGGHMLVYNNDGNVASFGINGSTGGRYSGVGANVAVLGTLTNNAFAFGTNNTERARIDSSGNVGIGTSSPSQRLTVAGAGTAARLEVINTSDANRGGYLRDTGSSFELGTNSGVRPLAFAFDGSEKARIDSSGNLLVGATAYSGGVLNDSGTVIRQDGFMGTRVSSNGNYALQFFNASGTDAGNITVNASTTQYVTSSDYRLKEAIAPMTGALAKVAALKPCTYKWKVDGSDGQGFIAHELAEVEAGCVTGEKDAVDAEGNPQYQGIDTSFLVATLTAAIQELKAIVDAQGAEIAALKGAI